ncbi:MAG TPA: hypothetical protein VLD39_11370, partial [Gammaproteobacteria bacterium]|nr:hypothetical protein [Gammaproteobacteria bacterium]
MLADCLALEELEGGRLLADRYRAIALDRLGYTAAATDRLASVIKVVKAKADNDKTKLPAKLRRERDVIEAMSPRLSIELGDLYLQSGRYDQAAKAYAEVQIDNPTTRHALVARRIYLALRAGDQDRAIDQAIELLGREDVLAKDAQLIAYLVEQGVPTEPIARRINSLLDQQVVLPRLVALAMVADKAVVLEQISAWLSREPLSPARLEQAVALVAFDDDDPADAGPLADLLVMLADRIKQSPAEALELARAAIDPINAPVTLLRAVQSDAFKANTDAYRQLVAAVTYESTGRKRDAAAMYQAIQAAEDPIARQVRLPLARLQLALGMTDEPIKLLGEPDIEADWDTFELSLRAMAAAGE